MNDQLIKEFTSRFGAAPEAVAQAPGRLEILGHHTDYNQGFVLSCAAQSGISETVQRKSST